MAETDKEKKPVSDKAQGYADIASLLGSYSTAKRQDRQTVGNQTQNYDQLMLQAQGDTAASERDSLRKLATTNYLKSGGNPYNPATIQMQGQQVQLPSFGFGPKATSAAQAQGASTLESQLLRRLQPGGTYQPTDVSQYTKPGTGERIADIGGLITGGLGALDTISGGKVGIGSLIGKIPGLGGGKPQAGNLNSTVDGLMQQGASKASGISGLLSQAAPYAGIATGALGLMKDRGWAGNLASGASTGAGIGSLVAPGIGTAVGAGIGAIGGLLRGIGGGPSKEELAGREAASAARQLITRGATQQQIQEAQGAGFENPTDALALIVLRDRLGEQGAEQIMTQLHQAEKQGPDAVNRILSMIGRG